MNHKCQNNRKCVSVLNSLFLLPVAPTDIRETICFTFLILRQSVRLLGWKISSSQGHYYTKTE
jgi:hypothetical protein